MGGCPSSKDSSSAGDTQCHDPITLRHVRTRWPDMLRHQVCPGREQAVVLVLVLTRLLIIVLSLLTRSIHHKDTISSGL